MNDISDNPYLSNRKLELRNYTLTDFLYKEIAVRRLADTDRVVLAFANILALLKFKIHYMGYRFLAALASRYVVKSDFDRDKEMNSIAKAYGTTPIFVKNSIIDAITINVNFVKTASEVLNVRIDTENKDIINETLVILAAIFVVYYNYYVIDESFASESVYAVNYGKRRTYG